MKNEFLADLQWRGLMQNCTDLEKLAARMDQSPVTVYCGFDPTARSLHVGNLIPLLGLMRFQRAGHYVIGLTGGATGLIGDPSGKSAERNLQSTDEVAERARLVRADIQHFLHQEGAEFRSAMHGDTCDNLEWTQSLTMLDFLRDVGKHFSVNAMIARDSVRSRLDREGDGISFTEFSYMLLQAYDFLTLFEKRKCEVQIGGSDQWGNMCSGVDLIRRKHGANAFALTFPLLVNSDGQKFGKTVNGAVWLDKGLTSVWDFYQFWLNTDDKDVIRYLKMFTFLDRAEIEELEQATAETPHARRAQRRLAACMTALVHGDEPADACFNTAAVLFRRSDLSQLSLEEMEEVSSMLPVVRISPETLPTAARTLVQLGLVASMARAHEDVRSGAVTVNDHKHYDSNEPFRMQDALFGRWFLVRKGKKSFALVEVTVDAA